MERRGTLGFVKAVLLISLFLFPCLMSRVLALGLLFIFSIALGLPPDYNCPPIPSHSPAQNVNSLRADDIGLVMAMGDSITAAFAAHDTDLFNGFIEYRSDSWSIGADPNANTIFNFFKHFNANAQGGAIGNSLPIDVYRMEKHDFPQVDPAKSLLNAAVSEAKLDDIPTQIQYLVNMTSTSFANYSNSWKFITILIGANDVCPSCDLNRNSSVPDVWAANLELNIQQLYAAFPKSFVAISYILNISGVWNVMINAPAGYRKDYCELVREKLFPGECGCLDGNATDMLQMDLHSVAFNSRIRTIAENWQAKNLPDFTVSAIPFFGGVVPFDLTFLSELDCFHPSWQAHSMMALQMWNSLWVPFAEKPTSLPNATITPFCPTIDSFLVA